MDKNQYLALLNAEVAKLPSGTMGGGTHRAARDFVDQMSVLTLEEIRTIIGMRKASLPAGPFRDWLASLPA